MKNLTIFSVLIFYGGFCQSQNFQSFVTASPNISWVSSSFDVIKQNKIEFGSSIALITEYSLSEMFSIRIQCEYLYNHTNFRSPTYKMGIPEIVDYYLHNIRISSLDLPFFIKVKNKPKENSFYFYFGYGLKYIFASNRIIDEVSYYMNTPKEKEYTFIQEDSFDFRTNNNHIGHYLSVGIGKNFFVRDKNLLIEIKYNHDLNSWKYPHVNDPINNVYPLRIDNLSLVFGTRL